MSNPHLDDIHHIRGPAIAARIINRSKFSYIYIKYTNITYYSNFNSFHKVHGKKINQKDWVIKAEENYSFHKGNHRNFLNSNSLGYLNYSAFGVIKKNQRHLQIHCQAITHYGGFLLS